MKYALHGKLDANSRKYCLYFFSLIKLQASFTLLLIGLGTTACMTGANIDSGLGTTSNTPKNEQSNNLPSPDGNNQTAENSTQSTIPIPQASPTDSATQNTAQISQNSKAIAPEKPKRTSLFSFGQKKIDDSTAQTDTSVATPTTAPTNNVQNQAIQSTDNTNERIDSDTVQIPPERSPDSQKKGVLSRLFGGNDKQIETATEPSTIKEAAIVPPQHKKDPHEYNDELPGVRPNGGIVIKHRSTAYDDTDIDANETDDIGDINLASLGGMGRSLPNGLRIARQDVQTSCLKPQLISLLKTVERRFKQPVIITSGYRSPSYNTKVNGAKRSMHMSCAAADILVPGVNKNEVAKFVRSLPGRGGVGTYCHQAIHVDVGPKRDWNWACSGKK